YIIDEVHMLSQGAFNALLKTLEEPPSYVIFILASTEPHKIPATILSRCQRFDFKRVTVKDMSTRMKEICDDVNVVVDDRALNLIARNSQ
ncbi:AAA family ATPase, partial [Faecalibacillus intestinalis]|uniref:AAA family ATPase n=1 Tax=Faecalibacillus intestinalis TaxID=1982626 RepID=UPI001EDED31A